MKEEPRIKPPISGARASAKLDIGRRSNNEDWYGSFADGYGDLVSQKGALYILADGMGGYQQGEVASDMAVKEILREYYAGSSGTTNIPADLERAFKHANDAIYLRSQREPEREGMGTTAVAVVIKEDEMFVAHVGDSRAYLIRGGEAQRLTTDHTWVQEQIDAEVMTEEEARTHKRRSQLTRALGRRARTEVDVQDPVSLTDGDVILLCSDGLSGPLTDGIIAKVASNRYPEEAAPLLVEAAKRRRGSDNLSTVIIRMPGGMEPAAAPGSKGLLPAFAGVAILLLVLAVGAFFVLGQPDGPASVVAGNPPSATVVVSDTVLVGPPGETGTSQSDTLTFTAESESEATATTTSATGPTSAPRTTVSETAVAIRTSKPTRAIASSGTEKPTEAVEAIALIELPSTTLSAVPTSLPLRTLSPTAAPVTSPGSLSSGTAESISIEISTPTATPRKVSPTATLAAGMIPLGSPTFTVKPTSTRIPPTDTPVPTPTPRLTFTPVLTASVTEEPVKNATSLWVGSDAFASDYPAPVLLHPGPGQTSADGKFTFRWQWDGTLGEDECFEIVMSGKVDGGFQGAVKCMPVTEITFNVTSANHIKPSPGGEYFWTVRVNRQLPSGQWITVSATEESRQVKVGDVSDGDGGGGGGGEGGKGDPGGGGG